MLLLANKGHLHLIIAPVGRHSVDYALLMIWKMCQAEYPDFL
jgi:hypothetical protein